MRCIACNRPFHATLSYDEEGHPSFSKLCYNCCSHKGEGASFSFEFVHALDDEPIVRVAKEKTIPTEDY